MLEATVFVLHFIVDTIFGLVMLLLLLGICTLIILLLPIIYAEERRVKLFAWVTKVRNDWRNRPRVKTGPMPTIGHPYR